MLLHCSVQLFCARHLTYHHERHHSHQKHLACTHLTYTIISNVQLSSNCPRNTQSTAQQQYNYILSQVDAFIIESTAPWAFSRIIIRCRRRHRHSNLPLSDGLLPHYAATFNWEYVCICVCVCGCRVQLERATTICTTTVQQHDTLSAMQQPHRRTVFRMHCRSFYLRFWRGRFIHTNDRVTNNTSTAPGSPLLLHIHWSACLRIVCTHCFSVALSMLMFW